MQNRYDDKEQGLNAATRMGKFMQAPSVEPNPRPSRYTVLQKLSHGTLTITLQTIPHAIETHNNN